MNEAIKSKEMKMTLDKSVQNICNQIENLNQHFFILHEDLHDTECKIIKEIIDNSKKILKNIYQNNVLGISNSYELKQDVHTLIKNCEIACAYGKIQAFEERTNYLYGILENKKQLENINSFW